MKRGFMKSSRYKRAISEKNNPLRRSQEKANSRHTPNDKSAAQAGADKGCDAMDVDMTEPEEVYADGRVVAVRTTKKPDTLCDEKNGNEDTLSSKGKDPKGKGKARMEDDHMDTSSDHDSNEDVLPPRPPAGRPGWGRHPSEDFFHMVPQSHGGAHRKRAVFRLWPRDPKGLPLMPSNHPKGTLSPDGYSWGATLYDFFHVNRIPHVPGMTSIMTGSALCKQVFALGELEAAAPEIEWAKSEGQPRMEGVANTEELISCFDMRLRIPPFFDSVVDKANGEEKKTDEDGCWYDEAKRPIYVPPPPEIPVTSPFHSSHYPAQWPSAPFEGPMTITLQERIPLYLLPQTLYVHDPFCLLSVRRQTFSDTSWTSRPDIVRAYNLHLSDPVCSQVEEARRKVEEVEEFKARTLIILRYTRTKEQIRKHEPIIEVPLPPYPRRPTRTEDSHLRITPIAKVGEGHHSIVYKAEWELPRNIFTRENIICRLCLEESADKEIKRLKETGRWEKMLRAASWGPNGFTGRKSTREELDAVNDAPKLEADGEIIEREITCIVPPNVQPSQILGLLDTLNIWDRFMRERARNAMELRFATHEEAGESTEDSYVPRMRINPQFGYVSQKPCPHDGRDQSGLRTAKFTVVAKLSLQHDPHLAREASNYQQFPERFFHHYNGYTIIQQLHAIVPVNAIVPQFYGYYKPQGVTKRKGEPSYLSPILLLEHCGEPIEPEEISSEDQEECASMLLRFQRAGWLHESVAPRNFLVQYGKPTEFPLTRQIKPEPSFRLIDFGRSRKFERVDEKQAEESETLMMFQKLCGQMGHTLQM